MPDILHRVGVKASTKDVYKSLATIDGLAGWWTATTSGDSKPGGAISFKFGDRGFFNTKVLELAPGKRVLWEVVDGPEDWVGTKIGFDLRQEGEQATVMFKHEGWAEPTEFMHHCSTKWATFLMSMKAYTETGRGAPFPDDQRVTVNWD
ncbi:MAG TPA: SRPBCC domain-containing protein [Hyphomonadaceae bacterium]|nr:SRPBCC domain-containing protein [Hyphomonadaceae bacterium]